MPALLCALALPPIASAAPRPAGVVIAHSPASSGVYLGSPAIAILAGGAYLAKHDEFGPGSTEKTAGVTHVYRSRDRGASWAPMARVEGMYWASLFEHRGAAYLLGTDKQDGRAVIARSTDGGETWSAPLDGGSGLLLDDGKHHGAPVPVVVHGGRIWRGMEAVVDSRSWGMRFHAFVLSAPAEADLLKASSWTATTRLAPDPAWLDGKLGGWLEGNAVPAPGGAGGGLVNMLRADYRAGPEKAAIARVSEDGTRLEIDPERGFVDFPGGCKKFTVRRDPEGKRYWSLANHVPALHRGGNPERTRNTLALVSSADLRSWEVRCIVLYHEDPSRHAFQYADWVFDGEDMVAACRTAFDDDEGGAHNQHDANYLTFHRFARFRALAMADSAPGAPGAP